MEPTFDVRNETLIARLGGEIDLRVTDDLRRRLERELDHSRARNLILNMSEVTFLDSSGLGVILGRYKRITSQGGSMALVGVSPAVRRVLEFSGMTRLSRLYDSEAEALASLAGGEGGSNA